jgi:orotate phosphoribosyltransferase
MAHLFATGSFTLSSGGVSMFKIDCDALTDQDWETLAEMIRLDVGQFGEVVGIPRGGLKLAAALQKYTTAGPRLIVDDVLTTGRSIRDFMDRKDDLGYVVFARGALSPNVRALFRSDLLARGNP